MALGESSGAEPQPPYSCAIVFGTELRAADAASSKPYIVRFS